MDIFESHSFLTASKLSPFQAPNMQPNVETQQDDCQSLTSSRGTLSLSNPSTTVCPSEEAENNSYHADLTSFPPGYRFCPTDEELLLCYLGKKVKKQPLPPNQMVEVNLYLHNPEQLAATYKNSGGQNELYFFTPRDRKYRNGLRPKRSAADGYWKATGSDREICHKASVLGYRKALVFYLGKAPKGIKTNWIMHEYRMNEPPRTRTNPNDMRLDDWVLCKIHKKSEKTKKKNVKDMDQSHEDGDNEENDNEIDGPLVDPQSRNLNTVAASVMMIEATNCSNPPQPLQLAHAPTPALSPNLVSCSPLPMDPMEDSVARSMDKQFMLEVDNNYNYAEELVPWNNILSENTFYDPLNGPLWGSTSAGNDPDLDSF